MRGHFYKSARLVCADDLDLILRTVVNPKEGVLSLVQAAEDMGLKLK